MRKRAFFLSQEGGGFPHHLQNTYDYLGLDKYAFAVRKNARPFWPPLLDQTINLAATFGSNDQFTKTGWGQTLEILRGKVFLQAYSGFTHMAAMRAMVKLADAVRKTPFCGAILT
jgi:hypothetical protein